MAASMNSDDTSSQASPDKLAEDFFSSDSNVETLRDEPREVLPNEPADVPRLSGASVASAADDELHQGPDLAPDFDEDAVLGRNRGLHIGAFFLVFGAAIAGGVAGYVVLRKIAAKDAVVAAASTSASAKAVAAPTSSSSAPVLAASAGPSASANKTTGSGRTPTKRTGDPSGFSGSNSGAGPGGVAGPGREVVGTGELSAGEISGVVERNRPLIRRRCWQPEVDARQGMGGSARVNTSFTIGPSGVVQSASASGAEADYPGLASCIAARIREWKFPTSGGSTPVNVPFVFAAQ